MHWNDPAEPMQVVGPIHFVGTQGLTSWLITTNDGHILLNTGMPPSGPMIEASIRKLGFKPEDVKLLLTCHAHVDHVGGLAYLQRVTGAQVVALDAEVELIQSGGKTDFNYGSIADFQFEPVKVDRVIHDGDKVTLGDVTLKALKTAGHTRGTTTWVTQVDRRRSTLHGGVPRRHQRESRLSPREESVVSRHRRRLSQDVRVRSRR